MTALLLLVTTRTVRHGAVQSACAFRATVFENYLRRSAFVTPWVMC